MKVIFFGLFLILPAACSSQYRISANLQQVEQLIQACELERAQDISQRFTVMGNLEEKQLAYQYLGVIYQDKKDEQAFTHTVERFLFSIRDQHYVKENVIAQWLKAQKNVKRQRKLKLGFSDCAA